MFDQLLSEVLRGMPEDFWGAMTHVLWRVDYTDALATGYSLLNITEALAWFCVAAWVIRRHVRRGGDRWNYAYALSFVAFGLTDVIESQFVPVWLIGIKGLNFALIIWLRWVVIRRLYPGASM